VKPSANAFVPPLTKTSFHLGELGLNPYTGRFVLGDVRVGNPAGYEEPYAFALSNLVVDVDMSTLNDEYVHVEEVTLENCFISYVSGGEYKVDNFKQIQYNVAGGREKYEIKQAKAKEAKARKDAKAEAARKAAEEEDPSARKLVIDRLTIRGIRVKIGPVTIPVPSITLTDLGKKSEGITMPEVVEQCWAAILKSATSLNEGVKALGDSVKALKLGDKAGKAADDMKKQADKAGEAVKEQTDKAVKALKGLFK